VILVEKEDWPFAVPLVRKNGQWYFDTPAGIQELTYRRVGGNELDAIEICHGFVEAQEEYALQKHDGWGVNQYAQRIISTPGKQDGLAWQTADGKWVGPKSDTRLPASNTVTYAPSTPTDVPSLGLDETIGSAIHGERRSGGGGSWAAAFATFEGSSVAGDVCCANAAGLMTADASMSAAISGPRGRAARR
jgi:Protein of unknown function (DUF2950)